MTTFDDARRIAAATLSAHWGYEVAVERWGLEDSDDYLLVVEEPVVVLGGPSYLVGKRTGTLSEVSYLDNVARIEAMRPVAAARPAIV